MLAASISARRRLASRNRRGKKTPDTKKVARAEEGQQARNDNQSQCQPRHVETFKHTEDPGEQPVRHNPLQQRPSGDVDKGTPDPGDCDEHRSGETVREKAYRSEGNAPRSGASEQGRDEPSTGDEQHRQCRSYDPADAEGGVEEPHPRPANIEHPVCQDDEEDVDGARQDEVGSHERNDQPESTLVGNGAESTEQLADHPRCCDASLGHRRDTFSLHASHQKG